MLPVVAQMKGSELVELLAAPKAQVPEWAQDALVASTRQTHMRMLRLARSIPSDLLQAPVATALSEMLSRLRSEKKWSWATSLKNLASTQGALQLLPMYLRVPHGISLKQDTIWQQTMQATARRAREEIPRKPKAMTVDVMMATLAAEKDAQKQAALVMMWFTAARVGCILQLHREDITMHSDTSMSVTFRRGKGVKLRGPYTVHTTAIGRGNMEIITKWMPTSGRIFTIKPADMLPTFRLVDKTLEAKSIRRGSLQAMVQHGVPVDTLMLYSGHTCEKTLLRYLDWGHAAGNQRSRMHDAGRALQQSP